MVVLPTMHDWSRDHLTVCFGHLKGGIRSVVMAFMGVDFRYHFLLPPGLLFLR